MKRYKSLFTEEFNYDISYLLRKYKEFNRLYFNNTLGDYPIKIKTLKKVSAKVVSTGIKNDPSTWVIKEIVFSNFTEFDTEEHLLGILLHEMIHIKNIEEQVNPIGGMHGLFFTKELDELRKKVSFNIPVTEDLTNLKVSKNVKKRETIAIILNTGESITTFNIKLKDIIIEELSNFPKMWLDKYKPTIVISDHLELNKYPEKRKINYRKSPFYSIDKRVTDEILKTGKILYRFE